MPDGDAQSFEASLPQLAAPVRIATLSDAQVFARRWAIRDKDPALKLLVRRLERVRSSEERTSALRALKQELAARNLLPGPPSG
jgi:hypothetical protein